ncbi:ubiquitin-conjugating enzyme E2 T-like [Xenia sp. Carnegie-2017]|uniref:ubiquitin-conjugating enzyme E2 T-like n=1 Tax=Xenia sp. Carnegie-2017 TaxID=2897299 RepID=UPI001F0399D2|nr:ubiquitin-conjugating enzyme E2 T-like [Xenia sp. Carnegie-2017]
MQRETRMKRELKMMENDPSPGISCWMIEDRIDYLQANIVGSEDTPYVGGIFKLDILIPERYPFEPPKVKFITPIYHPNIDNSGRICLDVLKMPPKGAWKPSWNVSTVLKSIQSLMAEPNPEDPLMGEISEQFKYHRQDFNRKAIEWTKKHAILPKKGAVLVDKTNTDECKAPVLLDKKRQADEISTSPKKVMKFSN